MHHAVVERDVGAGLELAEDVGVVGHRVGPRVDVDDRRAAPLACLKNDEATGWLAGALLPATIATSALIDVAVRGGHRARADPLEQRGHAGGVAQPGAVVDVVGVEAGADQLLEEVGLLVGALGRAEAGDRGRAVLGVDLASAAARRGRAPPPRWPRGSAAAPRRSRPGRRACARPCAPGASTAAPRRARPPTAGPWGRTPRGGSAAWSAAAARRRSPSRTGP